MNGTNLLKNLMKITGILGVLVFSFGWYKSYVLVSVAGLIFFLGMTNFGKECPLVLSVQYWYHRAKNKRKQNA
jgi:hypothetical protein